MEFDVSADFIYHMETTKEKVFVQIKKEDSDKWIRNERNRKNGEKSTINESPTIGSHAVRVVGWGEDGEDMNGNKDVKYWLCINSWGKKWGDNGTFRIRKGTNEANCERRFQTIYFKSPHCDVKSPH